MTLVLSIDKSKDFVKKKKKKDTVFPEQKRISETPGVSLSLSA